MKMEQMIDKLIKYDQVHILDDMFSLSAQECNQLMKQVDRIDFSILKDAKNSVDSKKGVITPLEAMELPHIIANKDSYKQAGLDAIRKGAVAALLLAGGMGTRLGSDLPKGMYNIGLTKELYIFEQLFYNLLDVVKESDTDIHLFIMTSEKNDQVTREFLEEKSYFGYNPEYVHFFIQDMAPATDFDGKVLMEEKGKIATSPNGNGGWYSSLENAGYLKFLRKQKIQWINVFAVDNVLQRIADPMFVGATSLGNYQVGAKVVRKANPEERVGVMCLEDGHPSIVEYYELTEAMIHEVDEKGNPAYNFGVILNYLFRLDALEAAFDGVMPLHVVEKKIPYINEFGEKVEPVSGNGYKYETLVLDMIKKLDTCLVFEVERSKEFAPIKNRIGVDSVETAQALLMTNGIEL